MSVAPRPIREALTDHVVAVVGALLPEGVAAPRVSVDRSRPGFSSDYQTPVAMQLAKILRRKPRDVADELAPVLAERLGGLVEEVDVSGPGFIGFRLSADGLRSYMTTLLISKTLGVAQQGGEHVVIDYSSPNVAKRMHVGHIRSTVIGDALKRMGGFLGYRVIGDNHIGDWGTQFGQMIYGWDHWLDEAAFEADPVAELERIYIRFQTEAKEDPELADAARAELAKLQTGDERNVGLWEKFREVSKGGFDAMYDRLGVHFDVTYGESHYNDALQPLVERLLALGIAEVSDGAVCVFFRDEAGEDTMTPFLVRKKDGAALYATSDLATVEFRVSTWNPARIIYVTDHRQKLHFEQLFTTCKKLGIETEFVHVGFGIMSSPEGALSTRAGNSIPLDQLLDEAHNRARNMLIGRMAGGGESYDPAELDALAEILGIGAIKYADLSNNPSSNIVFSWDRMLAFEGNTAPYLQYTSARTHSLQRRSKERGLASPDGRTLKVVHDAERELLLHLLDFGRSLRQGFDAGKPSTLATYLYDLASRYHSWYQACPVLKAEDEELVKSRLNLNLLTQVTLVTGLDLLGIKAPTRM
jgi:arginyl-tRNA synthetase